MRTGKNFGVWVHSMHVKTMVICLLVAVMGSGSLPKQTFVRAQDLDFVVDHNAVDASVIPQSWLDVARQQVVLFNHRSIGNNILDGMGDLETQDSTRYSIGIDYGYGTLAGINHYMAGNNGDPLSKVSGFSGLVQNGHDIAFMKFCVGDFPPFVTGISATEIWIAYRDAMEALQTQYPGVVLVWWTSPLTSPSDGRGLEAFATFNDFVRQHVAENGGVLFDIADIESHTPDGIPVTHEGYEAMWEGYTDDGGHLDQVGRQRVAQALWQLLARIAGWDSGANDWISIVADSDEVSVYPGETAAFTLSVGSSAGLSGNVTLDLQDAPSGAVVSFDPNPVTPPGSSQLEIVSTTSTLVGSYVMTLSGTAGQVVASTTLTLNVKPKIMLDAQPGGIAILAGDTAVYTVMVSASQGFVEPVALILQDEPPDTIVSFASNPVAPPGNSQMYITTTASTPTGIYSMTIAGSVDTLAATADINLVVASETPSFTLDISPTVRVAVPDQVVSFTVAISGVNGFNQQVTLEAVGIPLGVGVVWSNNPILPGGVSTLALSILSHPAFGSHSLHVVGTSGDQITVDPVQLIVDYPYKSYLPVALKQVQHAR